MMRIVIYVIMYVLRDRVDRRSKETKKKNCSIHENDVGAYIIRNFVYYIGYKQGKQPCHGC